MSTCAQPYITTDYETGELISCPCGRCPQCLKRRADGWAFRLLQEEKQSDSAIFVTLTYDTKHIPITQQGTFTLDKTHLQTFFKKLRWHTKQENGLRHTLPIKYFAVGEYGSENLRPHYHIILFNSLHSAILNAWSTTTSSGKKAILGESHFGTVTPASVAYTLKYMLKSGHKFKKSDLRKPEFQLSSKLLGYSYLQTKTTQWHKDDKLRRMYLNTEDNKKVAMPRYYKDKLFTKEDRAAAGLLIQTMNTEQPNLDTRSRKRERTINEHRLMNKNSKTRKL